MREAELSSALAASLKDLDQAPEPRVVTAYSWDFPGRFVNYSLHWFSSRKTQDLERLWGETRPSQARLRPFTGLIERFELETLQEYVDATPDQLATVHELL